MGRVVLVRHGQAQAGGPDYDRLSPLGIDQARLLGQWAARTGLEAGRLVSGTMVRHRATRTHFAAALAEAAAVDTLIETADDPAFDEFDFVDVVARHRPDLSSFPAIVAFVAGQDQPGHAFQQVFDAALNRWMAAPEEDGYRESWTAFRRRCVAGLHRLVADPGPAGTVTVFTSGGPIAAICQHVLDLDDHHAARLNHVLVNTGVTRLRFGPGRISLEAFNQAAHLEWPGETGLITQR